VTLCQTLARVPELDSAQCIGVQADACFCAQRSARGSTDMLDIIVLAIGLGFFALSVGYTIACDQL
jgi:hypothetical protein